MAGKTLSEKINEHFNREQWAAARRLLQAELKKNPHDHWLVTRLGTTYYEARNYRKALDLARKANILAPDCPLVLWDLAGSLAMTGDPNAAVEVYQSLLHRGLPAVANDECGEGETWAAALLTDCLYRLAECYTQLKDEERAVWCYRKHLDLRLVGAGSIYDLKDARRRLATLAKRRPELIERELRKAGRELQAV